MEEKANKEYIDQHVHPIFENLLVDILVSKPTDVKANYKPKKNEDDGSSEEEEEDEEEVDQLPIEILQKKDKTRTSVSAEAFGKHHKKEDFKPKIIQKKQDQKERITKRIMQAFMFSALDEKERAIVIDAMEEKKYAPGESIIKQGDDGDMLYILDQGEAECYRKFSKNDKDNYLKTYYPGESFGELALLYNCPRAATIIAKTNCILWGLDRQTFNHIVKDAAVRKREKYEEFLAKVEILKEVQPYERAQIADALKTIKAKKGESVIKQGEEGDIFFMVEEGELEAWKEFKPGDPPKSVMKYKKGDYFGELALLKNQPRAASVICTSDCTLVALDRYSFKRLLGPIDSILQRNLGVYEKFNKM